MTRSLGLAFISALGLPPVDYVNLAADLGCTHVSFGLQPMTANPFDFAPWSLREDAGLRHETCAALQERDVTLAVGEVFLVRPGADIADGEGDLALFAQMGAKAATILSIEPDMSRANQQIDTFVSMAHAAGIRPALEFMPRMPIGTLQGAMDQVARFDDGQLSIVLDCMHVMRSGAKPEELSAIARTAISEIQLCDVPMPAEMDDYGAEALHHRLLPGEGDLPLASILAHVAQDAPLSLEIPMLGPAEEGVGLRETLARAVAAARKLMAGV